MSEQVEPKEMLLVGLNNPSILGNEIDNKWNERRASSRPRTALHERRQQQLSEMKSQYLQPTKPIQPQIIQETHPLPQNKELANRFIEALDKFLEPQSRDSGVAQCLQLIEKNKDQQSLQTMIECLWSSSRKGLNPKTNTNFLAVDMELMTLGEILKQNDSGFNQYMIEKIFQIIKKNLNVEYLSNQSTSETTIQAIGYVVIRLLTHVTLTSIYQQLYECLHDKSRQSQVVHVLSLFCYYLKQQNKVDDLNMLGQLLFEVFSKLLIDSVEFLKCIEFLVTLNISYNHEILIQRLLRYCRVPINKSSTYYLIVAQVCTILEILGTKTRAMSSEVIGEMKKLTNDRRVVIQVGAKKVIACWEDKETKFYEPSLEQFFNKIQYCQVPYIEYQKKGFQSFMRASTFVRKNSRSPSLPKQKSKPQKIREKIQRIRSGSPKFQLLDEDQELKRIQALDLLKQKGKQQNTAQEIFEDSLEVDPFQKREKLTNLEQPIIVEELHNKEENSIPPQDSLKINKMPSLQFIDQVQTIKQSLHDSLQTPKIVETQEVPQIANYQQDQIMVNIPAAQSSNNQDIIINQKQAVVIQELSPQQSLKYVKIEPITQKVRAEIDLKQDQEIQIEEDFEEPEVIPQGVFPIREVLNFQASYQEFPKEFKTTNNKINYQLELFEEQNNLQVDDPNADPAQVYEKVLKETKVKSAFEPEQEVKEVDLSDGQDTLEEIKVQVENQGPNVHIPQNEKVIQIEQKVENEIQKFKEVKSPTKPESQLSTPLLQENQIFKREDNQINERKSILNMQQGTKNSSKKQNVTFQIPEPATKQTSQQYFELAISKINENINDAYQILFENCDDLQKIHFMMVAGPQINRLNTKMLNKIIEFMQKIKEAELLNVIGLNLYSQVKECDYFDEISHQDLEDVKEVLYDICGSEKEQIGYPAVNIYNEL